MVEQSMIPIKLRWVPECDRLLGFIKARRKKGILFNVERLTIIKAVPSYGSRPLNDKVSALITAGDLKVQCSRMRMIRTPHRVVDILCDDIDDRLHSQ